MSAILNRRSMLSKSSIALGSLAVSTSLPWGAGATSNLERNNFWEYKPRLTTRKTINWWDYPLKAKLNANENKFHLTRMVLVETGLNLFDNSFPAEVS